MTCLNVTGFFDTLNNTNDIGSVLHSYAVPLARTFGQSNTVPGLIVNQETLFALNTLLNGNQGTEAARNEMNIYYSVFFPTLSFADQFFSFMLDPDASIVLKQIAPLPNNIPYIDINFYLRGLYDNIWALPPTSVTLLPNALPNTTNEWNGSINQGASSYKYGVNGISSLILTANQSLITGNNIIAPVPIEYTQKLNVASGKFQLQCILFRVVKTVGSDNPVLNKYFTVKYNRPTGKALPFYFNLSQPGNYFIDPYRTTYSIDAVARAQFSTYANLFTANPNLIEQPVYNFFSNYATVYPGAIDSAYKSSQNSFNIFFDNRYCTYFTSAYFNINPGDTLYYLQFNHKLENRCIYASVSFYEEITSKLIASFLTIPEGFNSGSYYQLVSYTNNTGFPFSIGVGERLYGYPPPEYNDTQRSYLYILPFNPSVLV